MSLLASEVAQTSLEHHDDRMGVLELAPSLWKCFVKRFIVGFRGSSEQ